MKSTKKTSVVKKEEVILGYLENDIVVGEIWEEEGEQKYKASSKRKKVKIKEPILESDN